MMKSLYSGVSGLKIHNLRMDVIGNNIANVNTTAYKAGQVTFRDIFYQTKTYASSGEGTRGGVNPKQIGYGGALGTVSQVMTQSGLTYSDSVYDCALEGEGFFQVMDPNGNVYYTRAGVFNVDNAGNLVDPSGYIVLGAPGDSTGIGPSSNRISINIPAVDNKAASASKMYQDYEVNFTAAGNGPNGNISVTIAQADAPYATLSGTSLNVYLDLNQTFTSVDEFRDAVNAAIRQGGVNLGDDVIPLNIEIPRLGNITDPVDFLNTTTAIPGFNIMEFDATPNDPAGGKFGLAFVAAKGGAYSGKYETDFKVSTTARTVEARWSDNVLTVTVPGKGPAVPGDPDADRQVAWTIEDIQRAINEAAGFRGGDPAGDGADMIEGDWSKLFYVVDALALGDPGIAPEDIFRYNVALGGMTAESLQGYTDKISEIIISNYGGDGAGAIGDFDAAFPGSAIAGLNGIANFTWTDLQGDKTRRLGITNGDDSLFARITHSLSTVKLTDGRFAAEQSVDDLTLFNIDSDGVIYGEHPVHGRMILGRIDIATFENPLGLTQAGKSYFKTSLASGDPQVKVPGTDGAAVVVSGATEMSNVDLSQEFSDMIITQRGFQANSRVITVSDTMLEELINLKR